MSLTKCFILPVLTCQLLSFVYAGCLQKEDVCPERCRCRNASSLSNETSSVIIDCTSTKQNKIPAALPYNVAILELSNNIIERISEDDFKNCSQLKILRLSSNIIEQIDPQAFEHLTSLEELYLDFNNLMIDSAPTPYNKTFLNVLVNNSKQLTVLTLNDNINISESVVDECVTNITKLKQLSIDRYSENVLLPASYAKLYNLNYLSVHGTFVRITNDSFFHVANSSLITLNVKSAFKFSKFTELEPLAFSHFKHLKTLDLGYNQRLNFLSLSKAWYGLQYTNLSTLILSAIIPVSSGTVLLPSQFYNFLNLSQIKTLMLDRNNIFNVSVGFSEAFPEVEHLDLSFNCFGLIDLFATDASNLKKLLSVDMSYQCVRTPYAAGNYKLFNSIPARGALQAEDKRAAISSSNNIPLASECLALPLENCYNITNADGTLPSESCWPIKAPPSLRVLNVSASLNVQIPALPPILFIMSAPHNFTHLIYKSNKVKSFLGPLFITYTNPSLPFHIDLSDNEMTCLAPDSVQKWTSLGANITELNLSNNRLSIQLQNDILGNTFEYFKNLTILDLSNSGIKDLPSRIFKSQEFLIDLNLADNALQNVEFTVHHMVRLKYLNLSSNIINGLSDSAMENLDKLFAIRGSDIRVNIARNDIHCTCATLTFLRWMKKSAENFENFTDLSCSYNGKVHTFDQLGYLLKDLTFQCETVTILIIVFSVGGGIALVALVTGILLYRHRWDLRFWWIKFRRLSPTDNIETSYEYDAVVVYCYSDIKWVRYALAANLEKPLRTIDSYGIPEQTRRFTPSSAIGLPWRNNIELDTNRNAEREFLPLNLYVADRYDEPGKTKDENLIKSIRSSRKVILVLSQSFVKDEWCNLQLELARAESFARHCNIIVPIMLESLSARQISDCLQWIVRQYQYLEWPNQFYCSDTIDQAQVNKKEEEFWTSLKRVLLKPGLKLWETDNIMSTKRSQ